MTKTSTYRNPWHQPTQSQYGPARYSTDATPTEYRGFLLYERIPGPVGRCVIDVVRDGECVTQRAGMNGARRAVDERISAEDVRELYAPKLPEVA